MSGVKLLTNPSKATDLSDIISSVEDLRSLKVDSVNESF